LIFSADANHNKQEDKIRVAEEELDKILHAKEPDFQAPFGHQSMWDTFILEPALESQNEA